MKLRDSSINKKSVSKDKNKNKEIQPINKKDKKEENILGKKRKNN